MYSFNFDFTIQVSLRIDNGSQSSLLKDSAAVIPPQINNSALVISPQQLFTSPALPSQNKDVVFVMSEKEVTSDGSQSILKLAELQGVKIRSGCRKGSCGACKKRKLEGEVKYKTIPLGLEEYEQKAGYILPCIAYPLSTKIEIDA